ncbi:tyrosine-protein phosphatase non-receptor type 11-like isoform X4 [Lampetra planeri]
MKFFFIFFTNVQEGWFGRLQQQTIRHYRSAKQSKNRWFHQELDGPKAGELLMTFGDEGSFLVRRSSTNYDDYVLCVRQGDQVHHIKIQHTGDVFDLFGGEKFAVLDELVQFYSENLGLLVLKEGGDPILLNKPLPCREPTSNRWFHGMLRATEAEKLLLAPRVSAGSFLARESMSKPGQLALTVRSQDGVDGKGGLPVIIHVQVQIKEERYSIGDGKDFDSLEQLVDFYRSHAITAHTKSHPDHEFILTKPLCTSSLLAAELPARVQELERSRHGGSQYPRRRPYGSVGRRSSSYTNGFGLEYETLQLNEHAELTRNVGKDPCNKGKNRFKNILPFDNTRVVLKGGQDYINANYIVVKTGDAVPQCRYIATQGCLQTTVADLWSMVLQERSHIIVMATQEVERGKNKCFRYWPEVGSHRQFGRVIVRCDEERLSSDFTVRVLHVTVVGHPGQGHEVYQFQFKAWPDHGIPEDPRLVLRFLDEVNKVQSAVPDSGPMIVHCSAGIGRTGTLIVIDALKEQIKQQGLDCELDIPKTIQDMRSQRSGMVQTEAQYAFVYKCLEVFVQDMVNQKLEGGGTEQMEEKKLKSIPIYENIKPDKFSITLC